MDSGFSFLRVGDCLVVIRCQSDTNSGPCRTGAQLWSGSVPSTKHNWARVPSFVGLAYSIRSRWAQLSTWRSPPRWVCCSYCSLLPFLHFFLWVISCLRTEKLVWFLQLHKESTDLTNSSISRTRTETPNEIELLDNKKV